MKKFKLDLSSYNVTVKEYETLADNKGQILVDKEIEYPLRENISNWLRSPGVFRDGNSIAEAVVLAKTVRETTDDEILLDEREAGLLKQCLNVFIELTADGKTKQPIGGEIHEEAICRIFTMQEVK